MNNVIFTRVSFFRNLKDYKFLPKLDKEKAQEIENKVEESLGKSYHKVVLNVADANVINYLKESALIKQLQSTDKDNIGLFCRQLI